MPMLMLHDRKLCVLDCYDQRMKLQKLGAKWDARSKVWFMAFTPKNYECLIRCVHNLDIEEGLRVELEKQQEKEKKLAKIKRAAKADRPISLKIPGLKLPLFNYQKLGVMFTVTNGECSLIGDEMGLGKCETKNSRVITKSGMKSVGEIFEKYVDINTATQDKRGGEWFDVVEDVYFQSNDDNLKSNWVRVKKAFREKVNKTASICLENGHVTHEFGLNHKIFTSDMKWKRVEDISVGDWVATYSIVDDESFSDDGFTPEDAVFLAWQIAEGYEQGNRTYITQICSKEYREWVESTFDDYVWGALSEDKIIPKKIQNSNRETASRFLSAYFDAEACCNRDNLEVSSKSESIIRALEFMLSRFGIYCVVSSKTVYTPKWGNGVYWKITIGGDSVEKFYERIGFGIQYKKDRLKALTEKKRNSNMGESVPCRELLKELYEKTGLSFANLGVGRVYVNGSVHQNPSKTLVKSIIKTVDNILRNSPTQKTNTRWKKRQAVAETLIEKNRQRIREIVGILERMSSDDIRWEKVKAVEMCEREEYVYDFEVEGNHTYYVDSILTHNSIEGIATALWLKHNKGLKDCLVIVPAAVKWNWPLEIEKFTSLPYVVIDGKPEERVDQWLGHQSCRRLPNGKYVYESGTPFFTVVNYELVTEDLFGGREYTIKPTDKPEIVARKKKLAAKCAMRQAKLAPVTGKRHGMVVLDEAHAIKTHSSKRTRNIKKLRTQYRMALTGTPMDGKLEELHSIMEFIKPGLLPSKMRFLQIHAEFDYFGKIVRYKKVQDVKDAVAPYFLRRLKKDVMKELPDKTYKNVYIDFTPKERKIYEQIADRDHPATEDVLAITRALRCKQFCDHPELVEETGSGSKIKELMNILEEVITYNGEKVILFTQYKQMLDIIDDELKKAGYTFLRIDGDTPPKARADYQEKFNTDSHIDLIIGTEAMSTGLNLTGATYVVNYDENWAPAIMRQREDRAHRQGQKNAVTVVNLRIRDTIEERIQSVLLDKERMNVEVLGDDTDEMTLRRLNADEIANIL